MTKKYANWAGETPAIAIGNMIEFHEGKPAAKGYRERMVEVDEIINDAILQRATKEYSEPYKVIKSSDKGENDYEIILDTNRDNPEHIFGMDCSNIKNKAWLDYWCLRLNRAFVNGWMGSQGVSSWPYEKYYKELDRLFDLMSKTTI